MKPLQQGKTGRNDPCWCGSGVKYKKCHLNRESAKPVPFEAMAQAYLEASTQRRCLHPLAETGVCDKIASAHTIQRSGVLQRIVDSTNHVRTFHPPMPDATGRLQVHRVGWREASTFTGFCAKHDNLTFRALETAQFEGTAEQCFLVGYRALCHEIYQKIGHLKADPVLRRLVDRGLPVDAQRHIQGMWMSMAAGTRKGLNDLQKLKTAMDQRLLDGDYSGWRRTIIKFRGDLCVASTGAVSPNRDLDGKELQVLANADCEIEELLMGVVATPEGGAVVLVWCAEDHAPEAFVESLLRKENRVLPALLTQFMFAYIGNTYFSDKWWQSLSKKNRDHIESLAGIVNAYYTPFTFSSSKFVPWDITEIIGN